MRAAGPVTSTLVSHGAVLVPHASGCEASAIIAHNLPDGALADLAPLLAEGLVELAGLLGEVGG